MPTCDKHKFLNRTESSSRAAWTARRTTEPPEHAETAKNLLRFVLAIFSIFRILIFSAFLDLISGFEAKSQGEEPDAPDAAGSAPVQTTPVTPFTPVGQGKCNFQCPDLRGPEKAVCVAVSEQWAPFSAEVSRVAVVLLKWWRIYY